eukprot:TRINITY_DN130_c0_g1_i1.p1 TRINITY_DN130_c0_g1~~TRINITY_DN130_c0_g1_i1.p1  ORF type:complete len:485 (+),score=102.13 TRINITY_DN130_c0_g1_i1:143-1456(+)
MNDYDAHRVIQEENRARLLEVARAKFTDIEGAAIVLAGGVTEDWELYDTDVCKADFRQEPFFRYLFGINEPDCFGALALDSGKSILFVPEVLEAWERWNGPRRPDEFYNKQYGVTETYLTKEIDEVLQKEGIKKLFVLHGQNSDSGNYTRTTPKFDGIKNYSIDTKQLHPALSELRAKKTSKEIEMMRLANLLSSQAHLYVMRHIHPGMVEMQLEALFKSWISYFGGARHCAYSCICPSGPRGAILHYGHSGRPNDQVIHDGETVVLDMGGEFVGYATDITRSFAVNGKFTDDQRAIHNAVYEAQQTVIKQLKPGVSWPAMHRLAERVIIEHLTKIGILHNGTMEDYEKNYLASVFMPHGLGHLLGYDTHDVGGYPEGVERSKEPGLCWLRCGRYLEAGMVITVEPGIYFGDPTLDKALRNPDQAKFINQVHHSIHS